MNDPSRTETTTTTASATPDDQILAIARGFRLQWEPAQQAHVLLYPEGMVKLNSSSAEILQRVNGARSQAAIIAELQTAFADAPADALAADVRDFIAEARRQGWVKPV